MAILGRVLAGLALAAIAIAALNWALGREAAVDTPAPRAIVSRLEPADVEPVQLPASVPRGEAWLLYVAAPGAELPAAVAPVVEIAASGRIVLRRGAPPPAAPGGVPWIAAGIVLPGAVLTELTPDARAALLAVLGAWRGTLLRGTDERALTIGIRDPESLAILARWER